MAGNNKKLTEYKLSDGQSLTAKALAELAGIALPTARTRLQQSRDIEWLTRPLVKGNNNSKGIFKKYTLNDGSVWTVPELVKETNCTKQTVAARLHKSLDAARVLRPVISGTPMGQDSVKARANIKNRMFFDPDGFWKIFNRST